MGEMHAMSMSRLKTKMATVVMPIYDEAIFAIMALNDKPRMVSTPGLLDLHQSFTGLYFSLATS